MIDHTRQTQSMNLIAHVPLVTWVQDRLAWLFDEQAGRNMGPLDFCIGQSADELIRLFKYPADRFMSCEMATHAESLAPRASRPDPAEYSCDVAYATHASESPSEFHRVKRERAADSDAKRLIDAIYDCMNARAARCELNGALYLNVLVDQCIESIAVSYNAEERARFVAEFARALGSLSATSNDRMGRKLGASEKCPVTSLWKRMGFAPQFQPIRARPPQTRMGTRRCLSLGESQFACRLQPGFASARHGRTCGGGLFPHSQARRGCFTSRGPRDLRSPQVERFAASRCDSRR
ncbi:MAG: hypothetical protein IPK83_07795 [Planctomycetes bacterium]|nr:hypothetical protein [Planctomycetota bacterium]